MAGAVSTFGCCLVEASGRQCGPSSYTAVNTFFHSHLFEARRASSFPNTPDGGFQQFMFLFGVKGDETAV